MSERAPNANRLRSLSRIALGGDAGNRKEEVARAWRAWRNDVTPEVVAALVDRIEALAERIGNRSLIYMDNEHTFEAEMIGMIEEEIRAILREPLNTEDV